MPTQEINQLLVAKEAEIEMLRKDMEEGKIHIRVSQDQKFRQELAEKMVEVSQSEYDSEWWYVADPVDGVIFRCTHRKHPFYDDHGFRFLGIWTLFDDDDNDYIIAIDWCSELCSSALLDTALKDYQNSFPNKEVIREEFVAWIQQENKLLMWVQEVKLKAYAKTVASALGNIKDEIIINVNN